ncbi:helix-turn-helix domain-containing protein [Lysinibacillus sp. NPDC093688]|uniref:helix-turn-helix domain-containing protein n=1 Tax=Lysinibacillus sp. NPDC093688 TaxID=3390577 RepID=UPI003D016E1F
MNNQSLGENIRRIRKEKHYTIEKIAEKTGLTASFISQFERSLTDGSVATIKKIADALELPVSALFSDNEVYPQIIEDVSIVRKDRRKKMSYPDGRLTDYMLTTGEGKLQVLLCEVEVGGCSGSQYNHAGDEECIIILEGQMEITIDTNTYILNIGDTINFPSHKPHAWRNIGKETLKVIWIITPTGF